MVRSFHCCPNIFISFAQQCLYIVVIQVCVYIHTYLTAQKLNINYRCYQIILRNIFFTNQKQWNVLGPDLAVTGRIRDIGQDVLQSSFETESSSKPVTSTFFLIAFLEEAFISNTIIILWINYTLIIIICINNNDNAIIIVEDSKTLTCTSKIPMGTRKNLFEVYRQSGHASS